MFWYRELLRGALVIVLNTFTFPVAVHGTPLWSNWQRPTAIKTWYGVKGALTLVGANTVRECIVDGTMTNYPTYTNMENANETMLAALDAALKGTLNIDGIQYPRCLFLGWEPSAPAFYDGSGQHGWTQFVRLKWQQTR